MGFRVLLLVVSAYMGKMINHCGSLAHPQQLGRLRLIELRRFPAVQ